MSTATRIETKGGSLWGTFEDNRDHLYEQFQHIPYRDETGLDAAAVERVGVQYAAQQCSELLDEGVSGFHFYTLNRSRATREIYASLGLRDTEALAAAEG